ncbi:HDOD domain-containing protein [Pusillimonas sp.]|uniref:sensor domain-containing diguanylate cyclase n=1 Tax=Pusillimonas sp. TaxID=3040095 RepID=UPI0037CB18F9
MPTLPTVAIRLIDLAERATSTLDDFAELVTYDPALVGKLLRTANSPFYGQWRKVTGLSDAIGLMGLNATISLSLSFSLRGLSDGDGALGETAYWTRSLLTALAARTIAVELKEAQPEDFLLSGLLQDIGVLAMSAMFGSAYVNIYKDSADHSSLLKQEKAVYGLNHADIGAQLLKQWRLPERIYESVRRSHEVRPAMSPGAADIGHLSACVAAAASIADAWVQGASTEAFSNAYRSVKWYLAISPERYQKIITAMSDQMPEMEALFEFDLIDPAHLESIQESARELLIMRNLRLSEESVQASTQIQTLERRIAMLESHAQRDPLTGLYNRVYLERQLRLEFDRAMREQLPLCVAYIDVDRFKTFNDTYGHAVGDQVLINISHRMLSVVRLGDTLARYGGEEFVALFSDTRLEEAQEALQRMLAVVRGTPCLTYDGKDTHVTFSAGVAMLAPENPIFHDPLELLEASDRALYQTKSSGRGRITVYEPGRN